MPKKTLQTFHASMRSIQTALGTSIRKMLGGSDSKRWGRPDALFKGWDGRTERIASLVVPGASVIEFGAGRMVIRDYLPESCKDKYTPSDIVDRGPGTLVCDLNADLPPDFGRHDVAIFSGVLEYLNDVPALISCLYQHIDQIIASYAVTESNKRSRRARGWVNDFSSPDFVNIFENVGYICSHSEMWRSQIIYKFIKNKVQISNSSVV